MEPCVMRDSTISISQANILAQVETLLRTLGEIKDSEEVTHMEFLGPSPGTDQWAIKYQVEEEGVKVVRLK